MREQLLRRLHKEYRRMDRTGSLSPPLNRSFRSKRTTRVYDSGPDQCVECKKLEESQFNLSVVEVKVRRAKHENLHTSHPSSATSSHTGTPMSTLAFPKKSYSIETETPSSSNTLGRKSITSHITTSETITTKSNGFGNGLRRPQKPSANDVPMNGMKVHDYHMNGDAARDDRLNGNDGEETLADSSYSIEINKSHFNMTTTAESMGISEQLSFATADESNATQSIDVDKLMMVSGGDGGGGGVKSPTMQWYNIKNDTNNNEHIKAIMDASMCLDNNKNINGVYSNRVHEVYYMNGQNTQNIHSANESIVRIKSPESLDQNKIDSIISKILVDSLKNIIGGQGKANSSDIESNTMHHSSQRPPNQHSSDRDASTASSNPTADIVEMVHSVSSENASKSSLSSLSDSAISVIGGSSYSSAGGEVVVQRMPVFPRTDSLEVQPSSSSSSNKQFTHSNDDTVDRFDDDDLESLVDSLDDPNGLAESSDLDITVIEQKPPAEKPQMFFVPLQAKTDVFYVPLEPKSKHVPNVSNLLPEKLRKRLAKRQNKMTERKEAENRRRQENIQKIIQEYDFKSDSRGNCLSFKVVPYNKTAKPKKSIERARLVPAKKANASNKHLRTEIGLLESYTIDAKGNLQWSDPIPNESKPKSNKPATTIRHMIKKTVTTTAPSKSTSERSSETSISSRGSMERRTKPSSNQQRTRTKPTDLNKSQESLKNALVQRPVLEQMTPDPERGPRRMYQKTEIHQGAKRIEILEIVECIDGTPDNYSQSTILPIKPLMFNEKFSKIPVPLRARIRDRASIEYERRQSDDSLGSLGSLGDTSDSNKSNDNGNDAVTITTISSPEMLNNAKRIRLGWRSNGVSTGPSVNGKRSAHNSAKYHQIFDAIPEEKCTSVSTESSANDDMKNCSVQCDLLRGDKNITKTSPDANANVSQIKMANGKAAIESDQAQSAEAWYDCFGRAHIDSDSVFMEPGM